MKKRNYAAVAAVLTVGVLLVGCSGKREEGQTAKTEISDAGSNTGDTSGGEDMLDIAILLNGTLGDKAFFDSAANCAKMIREDLGDNTKVVEMSYDETKWMPTLIDFSEDKETDIIVVGTWQMSEKLQEIAPQYPEKKYIIYDATVDYSLGGLDNVYSIEYKQNECSFLAGAVAAMETKTGTVGFVGGMENNVINDFLVGYIQGAKYVNDEIKIPIGFVGSFSDSAKAKELSLAQINQNADIIYQAASTAGLGVIDAVTEKDKFAIGVDSDQAEGFFETDREKAEHILTSALKRIDESLIRAIKMEKEGTLLWGKKEVLGIREGAVWTC